MPRSSPAAANSRQLLLTSCKLLSCRVHRKRKVVCGRFQRFVGVPSAAVSGGQVPRISWNAGNIAG